jgi:hypothetical protein
MSKTAGTLQQIKAVNTKLYQTAIVFFTHMQFKKKISYT